jgi:hypothetical protein
VGREADGGRSAHRGYRDRHSRAGGYVPRNAVIGVLALPFLAVLVVLGIRIRWMPAVTVPFATLGVVGAFVGPLGLADRLTGTLGLTILAATVLQLLGLTTAAIAGIVATVQNYRGQSQPRNASRTGVLGSRLRAKQAGEGGAMMRRP